MSDKMVEVAMSIIINAGDARTCAADAMQAELRGDRAAADAKLKEADEAIKKAAQCADRCDPGRVPGQPHGAVAAVYACTGHRMTIISEVSMIRLMIQMNRNLEDKINGNRN